MPKPCRRKVFQIPCTALSAEATARWLSVRFVFLEGHKPRMMRETAYRFDVIRDPKCVVSSVLAESRKPRPAKPGESFRPGPSQKGL